MTFDFKSVLAEYLKSKNLSVSKVTSYEQSTEEYGYCDTCQYTEVTVIIDYLDNRGTMLRYEYCGDMAGLISELEEL